MYILRDISQMWLCFWTVKQQDYYTTKQRFSASFSSPQPQLSVPGPSGSGSGCTWNYNVSLAFKQRCCVPFSSEELPTLIIFTHNASPGERRKTSSEFLINWTFFQKIGRSRELKYAHPYPYKETSTHSTNYLSNRLSASTNCIFINFWNIQQHGFNIQHVIICSLIFIFLSGTMFPQKIGNAMRCISRPTRTSHVVVP